MIRSSLGEKAAAYFQELQDTVCLSLEKSDGKAQFREDRWTHAQGGGGRTRILEGGDIFEKAGVNHSALTSELSAKLAERLGVDRQRIYAAGLSLVLHPLSPMVPTVHMNVRYIELAGGDAWFGGGMDLTPYYLFEEDARHFHRTLKAMCDRHDATFYQAFKRGCDEYFFIRHRGEARGIGGIFFDELRDNLEQRFSFVRDAGGAFLDAYLPILDRRRHEPWDAREKEWQLVRRGRYVEFNLIYDRGTLFGLETGGRTESILMSLPPEVRWNYNVQAPRGTREAALLEILKHPKEWV